MCILLPGMFPLILRSPVNHTGALKSDLNLVPPSKHMMHIQTKITAI